jgi:hypothetical protein
MAVVESTTIDGRSRPCVSENSPLPNTSIADGSGMKPLIAGSAIPDESTPERTSAATPTFAPRRVTVGSIGPSTPDLRMRGWWLDRAGFGVGTAVRVQVSERRLVVEAVEQREIPRCAVPDHRREGAREYTGPSDLERAIAPQGGVRGRRRALAWYRSIDSAAVNALREVLPVERRRECVSRSALSTRADVSSERIRAFEEGGSLPSIPVFIALAWSLGLDPRELLGRMLARMRCQDASRPSLCHRAAPDLPVESADEC